MITIDKNIIRKSLFLVQVLLLVLFAAVVNQSCTKLDESLYGEVTPDNFFKSDEEFVSALGAAYTQFGNYASGSIMDVQELLASVGQKKAWFKIRKKNGSIVQVALQKAVLDVRHHFLNI